MKQTRSLLEEDGCLQVGVISFIRNVTPSLGFILELHAPTGNEITKLYCETLF